MFEFIIEFITICLLGSLWQLTYFITITYDVEYILLLSYFSKGLSFKDASVELDRYKRNFFGDIFFSLDLKVLW